MEAGIRGWIWSADLFQKELADPVFVYFRKKIQIPADRKQVLVRLSADSRYKFYVNGVRVAEGPAKGNAQRWYYDTIDITEYLTKGDNIFCAEVLRYPRINKKGNEGIWRTETPGFYLAGEIRRKHETELYFADSSWKCRQNTGIRIVSEAEGFAPLQIYESVIGCKSLNGWMLSSYDDSGWEECREYTKQTMESASTPANQCPRTIPFMKITPGAFVGISKISRNGRKEDWEEMLWRNRSITIPANMLLQVDFDAGEEMTAYLRLKFSGGSRSEIKLVQAECYAYLPEDGTTFKKGDRTDSEYGQLYGFTDDYKVCAENTGITTVYEPFWFRTFRYVQMVIQTYEEPLTIDTFTYDEIAYPLEIQTHVETSESSMAGIWDISLRSLKRCMHETYEDCPFYEQIQYAMDSRNQMLYTYTVSADDRLARKCMEDFRNSQRADGLLNGSAPCYRPNVIPGFSVYYIGMLFDHMMYFGDKELIRDHLPTVDGILNYFHRNLTPEGIVGVLGGLNGAGRYWSFIDWTHEWEHTTGVPDAILQGAVTMESFLYVLGLQYAAELCCFAGREAVADEYLERSEQVKNAINCHCRNSSGVYQDGPGVEKYSQHCQVFAVLTGTVSPKMGRTLLMDTLNRPEKYAQCSVAMMFYLFRAMELCGLYKQTKEKWGIWKEMLAKNLTTCVEDPVSERSDCHAWGALALYELPSVILGIRPGAPGYEWIDINPKPDYFEQAGGTVITPKGLISVSWQKKDGMAVLELRYPEHLNVKLADDMKMVFDRVDINIDNA